MAHPFRAMFSVFSPPGESGSFKVSAPILRPFRTLGAADDGATFNVSVVDGDAWETRTGCVYNHATRTLTRGTFAASSTGSAINLSQSATVMAESFTATQVAALQTIAAEGGGGGGGSTGTVFSVSSGGSTVVTAPDPLESGTYGEDTAIVALAASTGSYSQTGHTVIGVLPPIRQESGAFVTLPRYTFDGGLTWYIRGVLPGEPIGTWTWTNLKTLNATTYDGCVAETTGIVADYDGAGTARTVTLIARHGRWRPISGRLPLRMQAAPTTAHSNTALTSAAVIALPDDFLASNDAYEIKSAVNKVNDNGTGSITFYVGRNGTTADAAVSAYTLAPSPNTSNSWGGEGLIKIDSDVAARQLGNGLPTISFVGTNTNQAPSAVTIASITGGVINLTIGTAVANALDTISLSTLVVELITG